MEKGRVNSKEQRLDGKGSAKNRKLKQIEILNQTMDLTLNPKPKQIKYIKKFINMIYFYLLASYFIIIELSSVYTICILISINIGLTGS